MKLIVFVALLASSQVWADEMNLNELMPTRLEDSSPTDVGGLDVQFSTAFDEVEGNDEVTLRPNLRYGVNKAFQVEALGTILSGGDEEGSGETLIGGLYEVYKSKNYLPSVGLNAFYVIPSGKGQRGEDFEVKVNLSTTLKGSSEKPDAQVHFNYNHAYNDRAKRGERLNRGTYAFGFSYRLSSNTALVTDVVRDEEREKGDFSNLYEVGAKQSLGGNSFLGAGVGVGFGDESPSWTGTIALEKQF